ncbi:guanosine monophosphate reductase [Candidatus Micrarchaeota archaeon CG_4_10_14_0_2_um_filter_55_9]|nr:MAG: guanosine monophosphate reductase [Candidatus Micrarchaeota archaeon CG1_02_55_41]PIO02702.1 MAG: guanosine monophosphate reductase [Candidatus Micrarchaeota archaeon CG09_land_8_20_14_0_10_55_25]PIZ92036.1 MAG: guanosine monophosphate reductase [Candidatus Micrarchaeota archaeon CG_4_10_14_0_2_um_filter_55_9]PJD00936.1 MAG: guanosine monophosphate reductase [Candidatus Micrarchaeota archaeon CG10_big_fil_rev_8_21_14_0_10_54_18]
MREALSYDDVLLVPQRSNASRRKADLATMFTKKIALKIPFCSAAMDTVTEKGMAIAIAEAGGIGVIHRNLSAEEQAGMVAKVKSIQGGGDACVDSAGMLRVATAIGTNDLERVKALQEAGVDAVVIDRAHGHHESVLTAVKEIKAAFPGLQVVAGNVVTEEGARDLVEAGVDAVKVGVGPGAICTTRVVTGFGVPQLTAIMDAVRGAGGVPVIADGGVKYSGDAAKALAAGASSVMMGSMFAGTDEAPGEVVEIDGKQFKNYRGMGSTAAMEKGSKSRYGQEGVAGRELVAEGVEGSVECKGSVKSVLHQLAGGVKSALAYGGAENLVQFREKAVFVRITGSGHKESHPHSLYNIKEEANYRVF